MMSKKVKNWRKIIPMSKSNFFTFLKSVYHAHADLKIILVEKILRSWRFQSPPMYMRITFYPYIVCRANFSPIINPFPEFIQPL